MARRIVSLFLALVVPCWMQAAMGSTACPTAPRDSGVVGRVAAELKHYAESSSQPNHECCPPVPEKQGECEHATARGTDCSVTSADCCSVKAPTGQLPPGKTTGPVSSSEAGFARMAVKAPEDRAANWTKSSSPPAEASRLKLSTVLRN